jgi:hypothetical protein
MSRSNNNNSFYTVEKIAGANSQKNDKTLPDTENKK